jgi:type III secretion protein D
VAPVPFSEALRTSEFAHLRLERDERGEPVLRGRLDTLAQRTRLDAWLIGRPGATRVQVEVEEQLARDVADVFRVNGVAVRARSVGAAQVLAEATEPDPARLARAEEVVRRDVRGLGSLTVHNLAAPPEPPAPPVVDDPGKRIASIVTGDPAYLVTVDGARYFVGAMLPTGHRINAIEDQRVTLELNGRVTDLDF